MPNSKLQKLLINSLGTALVFLGPIMCSSSAYAFQASSPNIMQGWSVDAGGSDPEAGILAMKHQSGANLLVKVEDNPKNISADTPIKKLRSLGDQYCSDIKYMSPEATYGGSGRYLESHADLHCAVSARPVGSKMLVSILISPTDTIELRSTIDAVEQVVIQSLGSKNGSVKRGPSAIAADNASVGSDPLLGRAVPRPVGVASTLSDATVGFPPMRTNEQIRWYLFPGGIAHNCDDVDPRSLTMTLDALEAQDGCEAARWRKVGNRTELQVDDDDDWEDVTDTLEKPVPKGMRLDAHYVRQGGYSSYNTNVVTSGGVQFTRDGQFQAARSTGFGGSYGGVSAIGSGSSEGLSGTYELDGYILKVTNGGQTTYRYIYFAPKDGKPYGYVQFEGKLYWDE